MRPGAGAIPETYDEIATCDRAVMDDGGIACGKRRTWEGCSKPEGNTQIEGVAEDVQICDMAGNVWEWVEDCYHDSYPGAADDGSAWVSDCTYGSVRVLRGGSMVDSASSLRAAYRQGYGDGVRYPYVGFRVVAPVAAD